MSSTALGLLYGVQVHDLDLGDPDDDENSLVARWRAHSGEDGYTGLCLTETHAANEPLVGYWIGIERSDNRAIADLDCVISITHLSDLEIYHDAKDAWQRFASWYFEQTKSIPPKPQVWLTPTEVA